MPLEILFEGNKMFPEIPSWVEKMEFVCSNCIF